MPASSSVSILLPIYNAEQTLQEAVESLVAQTFDNFEIVAVDDGSTDRTHQILLELASHEDRLRVVPRPHEGLIPALNTGLEHCQGDLVARFDADDRAHPRRLEKQVEYLRANPGVSVVGTQVRCFPYEIVAEGFRVYEDWINSLVTPADIAREIFVESPLVHPTITARRSDLLAIGGYADRGWAEDYDLLLRLHVAGHRMAKVPEVLHDWREGPARLTRTDPRYSVENFLRAKAHYLIQGPLETDRTCIIWGAGQMGRRLSKHLVRAGVSIVAFVDIDPKKIGNTRRDAPIIAPDDLGDTRSRAGNPMVLAAVPSRGARQLIRENLDAMDYVETEDYLCVA